MASSKEKEKRRRVCTGKELAEALAGVELTPDEARAWRKDRAKSLRTLKKAVPKW